jgi:hypothetical protein
LTADGQSTWRRLADNDGPDATAAATTRTVSNDDARYETFVHLQFLGLDLVPVPANLYLVCEWGGGGGECSMKILHSLPAPSFP